jgi:sulfur relay (sulfurtransferase) complex TusBCD TusD component (DsrE family)
MPKCQFCDKPAAYQCDHILGWNQNRMSQTCDAHLCNDCRTQVGICTLGGLDSIDRCPLHKETADASLHVLMTDEDAEAIRRRNAFRVVG